MKRNEMYMPYHPCCCIDTNCVRALPLEMNVCMLVITVSAAPLKQDKYYIYTVLTENGHHISAMISVPNPSQP